MRLLTQAFVRVLLLRTFSRTLGRQIYIKLGKFTRRSGGPKSFLRKVAAGYPFVRDMSRYNRDVLRRSRICLNQLVSEQVEEVFVYGERDVREALYNWTFEIPVKVKIIREYWENKEDISSESVPLEVGAARRDKIIVASLVNIEERTRRLRELGVESDRIVLLN
jgi:hypothetical protein